MHARAGPNLAGRGCAGHGCAKGLAERRTRSHGRRRRAEPGKHVQAERLKLVRARYASVAAGPYGVASGARRCARTGGLEPPGVRAELVLKDPPGVK